MLHSAAHDELSWKHGKLGLLHDLSSQKPEHAVLLALILSVERKSCSLLLVEFNNLYKYGLRHGWPYFYHHMDYVLICLLKMLIVGLSLL